MPVSALKATLPQIGCEPLSVSLLKLGDLPKKWQTSSIFHRGLTLTWRIWTRPGLGGLWCSRALRRKVKPTRTRTAISNTTWVFFGEFYYEKKEKETITILWNLQFDIFWNWNGKLKSWLLKFDAKKVWWLFAKSKKDNSQKKCPQLCISIYGLYSYFSINLYRRNRSYHDWGQHVVRMLLFFQLNDMKSDKMSDEWSEKWFWFCEGIPHSLMMW